MLLDHLDAQSPIPVTAREHDGGCVFLLVLGQRAKKYVNRFVSAVFLGYLHHPQLAALD